MPPRIEIEKNTTTAYITRSAAVSNAVKTLAADFSFSAAEQAAATRAVITAFTNDMVMTYSGTAPTTTLGHIIAAGQTVVVTGPVNVANLQFIRLAADGTVAISLEK